MACFFQFPAPQNSNYSPSKDFTRSTAVPEYSFSPGILTACFVFTEVNMRLLVIMNESMNLRKQVNIINPMDWNSKAVSLSKKIEAVKEKLFIFLRLELMIFG